MTIPAWAGWALLSAGFVNRPAFRRHLGASLLVSPFELYRGQAVVGTMPAFGFYPVSTDCWVKSLKA